MSGGAVRRIAINAQLNPTGAGGVETNLLSMLQVLAEGDDSFAVSLLALPRYVDDFRKVARFAKTVPWTLGQTPAGATAPPISHERQLRRALGPHARLVDVAVAAARRARYGRIPDDLGSPVFQALRQARISAVHFPAPQLFETRLPFIYEPWDLQYLHYPDFFTEDEFLMRDRSYRYGCHKARLVLTATDWVKQDIVKRLGVSPRKVVAIHRGSLIAREALTDAQVDAELAALGVGPDFIFYPAMCFEHKNHLRLLRALAILRDRDGLTIPLVLSGRRHRPFLPVVEKAITDLGLEGQVKVLGVVSHAALAALYRRARFMVFPSLFEGLGLPVLEAFHHGTPVLAARETCLPEVIGDAGVLFDARDEQAIATAIGEAWRNPQALGALAEKGRARLEHFSWQRGRVLLNACYKHVLGLDMTDDEAHAFSLATAA